MNCWNQERYNHSQERVNKGRLVNKLIHKNLRLPAIVFVLTAAMLSMVQISFTANPLIILERFIPGGGWVEIMLVSLYGAIVIFKMQNPANVPKWRRITWTIFLFVFFTQLALGLLVSERFLMTGRLHLPVPAMIISGPLYRGELSVMTILFISTVLLTGPAWCSELCYLGAFDNLAAVGKTKKEKIRDKKRLKATFLILVIGATLILRWTGASPLVSTMMGLIFGLAGIVVMILFSRRQKRMVHCTIFCPVGTVISLLKPVNPFRLYIDESCDLCRRCTTWCKYDALNIQDIRNKKPDYSCTLCGDCISSCPHSSIRYRFLNVAPEKARNLYLVLTITLHAVFLALARI